MCRCRRWRCATGKGRQAVSIGARAIRRPILRVCPAPAAPRLSCESDPHRCDQRERPDAARSPLRGGRPERVHAQRAHAREEPVCARIGRARGEQAQAEVCVVELDGLARPAVAFAGPCALAQRPEQRGQRNALRRAVTLCQQEREEQHRQPDQHRDQAVGEMATLDELEYERTDERDRAQVGNALEVALRKLPAQAQIAGSPRSRSPWPPPQR